MNLTSPPPVEQLDPEYAADLKHHLVRQVRKRRRTRWTPFLAWVPIVAATAAIAIITAGVVALSRDGDADPAGPVGVLQESPDETFREWIEIGNASQADARTAARQCLAVKKNAYGVETHLGQPSDADTATIRSARWIKAYGVPGKNKQLLQTFVTKPDNFWFQCLDGEVLRWDGFSDDFGAGIGADGQDQIPGTWSWSNIGEGQLAGVRASYSFRAARNVDLVELRIRGMSGVSPWYSEIVVDQAGYVAGILPGAAAQHGRAEIDVRAYDKDGKQVFFKTFG